MNAGVAFMRQDRKHLERQVADRKTLARLILRARTVLATASKETRTVFYFVAADGVRSTGGGGGDHGREFGTILPPRLSLGRAW
jgi:hypothetical protein